MVAGCTPEQLMKAAGSLRRALALPSDRGCSDSLLAVLFRSTNPSNDADIRATHGFLVCLYAASQLVTAAAHADDYPAYPEHLLISMSLEMRRYLHEFDSLVRSAPPVPPRNP
jgi:hypothetical protein